MTTGVDEMLGTVFISQWVAQMGWFTNAVLAVIVTAFIFGIIYVIAYAINSFPLRRYATSEFLQLAATALMVIGLVTFIQLGSAAVSTALEGLGVPCMGETYVEPISAAMCKTEERLIFFDEAWSFLRDDVRGAEWFYYFTISYYGVPLFQGLWVPSIHRQVETAHYLAYKIVSIQLSLNAQMFLLKYIRENMLTIFLPLGIILRTFYFTRGIGGFFIALALSLYFIYPTALFIMTAVSVGPPAVPVPSLTTVGLCDLPMYSGMAFGSANLATMAGTGGSTMASASVSNIASFVNTVFVRMFYENMVAFAIALTALRYAGVLLGTETGVFLNMVSRWI